MCILPTILPSSHEPRVKLTAPDPETSKAQENDAARILPKALTPFLWLYHVAMRLVRVVDLECWIHGSRAGYLEVEQLLRTVFNTIFAVAHGEVRIVLTGSTKARKQDSGRLEQTTVWNTTDTIN